MPFDEHLQIMVVQLWGTFLCIISRCPLEELDAVANRFIKSWAGIPLYGSNPVLLYLPKTEKGLGVVKLSHYWANLGLVREHLLKYSGDPCIRELARIRLHKAQLNAQTWALPTAL